LEGAWKGLAQSLCLPMQDYAWVRACAGTLAGPGELYVVVIEDGGRPVAIAPLVRRRLGAVRLRLLGLDELFEPMDLVYGNGAALAELAGALVRLRIPMSFRRVPAESASIDALDAASRGRGLFVSRPGSPYPRILLDSGWTRPLERLSSSRRSLLRRMRRRADAMGTVEFEILTPTRSNVTELLEEAYAVEAASWKSRNGTALSNKPAMGDFFRSYARLACDEGILRLCFLRINGHAAAMLYAVEFKDRFWTFKIGYVEEYASCSPGNLLMEEAIRYSAVRELKSFEFLGAVEDWTRAWTRDQCECVWLRYYPIGFEGTTALALDSARYAAGKLRTKVDRR
ncbi:MAG: GNAT family N-acetyltransferase, partial [bacterium]